MIQNQIRDFETIGLTTYILQHITKTKWVSRYHCTRRYDMLTISYEDPHAIFRALVFLRCLQGSILSLRFGSYWAYNGEGTLRRITVTSTHAAVEEQS